MSGVVSVACLGRSLFVSSSMRSPAHVCGSLGPNLTSGSGGTFAHVPVHCANASDARVSSRTNPHYAAHPVHLLPEQQRPNLLDSRDGVVRVAGRYPCDGGAGAAGARQDLGRVGQDARAGRCRRRRRRRLPGGRGRCAFRFQGFAVPSAHFTPQSSIGVSAVSMEAPQQSAAAGGIDCPWVRGKFWTRLPQRSIMGALERRTIGSVEQQRSSSTAGLWHHLADATPSSTAS